MYQDRTESRQRIVRLIVHRKKSQLDLTMERTKCLIELSTLSPIRNHGKVQANQVICSKELGRI